MTKMVRIDDESCSTLAELAGKFQTVLKKPVSVDGVSQRLEKGDIMNLAGSWNLSDEEAENLKKEIEELWSGRL
jgi:hypothetical protein